MEAIKGVTEKSLHFVREVSVHYRGPRRAKVKIDGPASAAKFIRTVLPGQLARALYFPLFGRSASSRGIFGNGHGNCEFLLDTSERSVPTRRSPARFQSLWAIITPRESCAKLGG